jgi:hypothetical protein
MINVSIKGTRLPESVKLASKIAGFCFEQECGELEFFTDAQKKKLKDAQNTLMKVASKYVKK